MIRSIVVAIVYLFAVANAAYAQTCTVPNTLTNGTNADATQVMANFNALLSCVNAIAGPPLPPQGRLTLQSGVPVMTTSQSAKTVMIYTPYVGNQIPIYNGTNMVATTFTELTIAIADTTKNPSAIGASKVNDWFVWNDAGTIRLSHGPDWTSDTARSTGTALTMVNGVLLNNVGITNGPAASRGTYVGTTRSDGSSQLDWTYGGTAVGGVAAFFGVWNTYNRKLVSTQVLDSSTSHVTTSGTTEPLLNSANNRVSYIAGLAEDSFAGSVFASTFTTTTSFGVVGIGYDSTSAITAGGLASPGSNSSTATGSNGEFATTSLGFHFMQALELAANGGNATFFGSGQTAGVNTGMSFQGMM